MLQLAIATAAIAVVLLVPGYCLLRAVGVERTWSVAIAPALSVGVVALLGEVYARIGIDASPINLVLVPSLVFAVIAAVRRFPTDTLSLPRLDIRYVALYVLIGFVAGYIFFIRPMGATDSYFKGVDYVQHINETRAFMDSKTFTSFGASYYMADSQIDPAPGHGFYPSGYHAVCACAAMMTGQELTVIINACNLCACALVWTLGVSALFAYVFEDQKHAMVFGALVAVGSSTWPWGLLVFGPIFPNLLSFAMVPDAVVLFAFILRDGIPRRQRATSFALFVLAIAGIALTQPNAAITAAVFLIPYIASRILNLKGREFKKLSRPVSAAMSRTLCGLFLVACVGIWFGLVYLPAMYGIVTFIWWFTPTPLEAILNALCFTNVYDFGWVAWQPIMGLTAVLGAVYTIRTKKLRWLAWTAFFGQALAFICFVNLPPFKNYAGGFWYTDPWRMSCMAIMLTMPLCVLGLVWLSELLEGAIERMRAKRLEKAAGAEEPATTGARGFAVRAVKRIQAQPAPGVAFAIVLALFAVTNFWGITGSVSVPVPELQGLIVPCGESAWQCHRRNVRDYYNNQAPYTNAERAFVRKVIELTDNALVYNDPFDGSIIAYGADGLRTCNRYVREYNSAKSGEESDYLRENISKVATDEEVQRILEKYDVHYLMQLSHKDKHNSFFMGSDNLGNFDDFDSIDGNTPGFEVIYQEDDMVLYRITAID